MLFTSYQFVLGFLPVTLLVVLGAARFGKRVVAKVGLLLASLVFYAWWNPPYLLLLLALLGFNYAVGTSLIRTRESESLRRKLGFLLALAVNIGVLIYFKYTNFLVREVTSALGVDFQIGAIVLPLGISFIIFQKIAFLVDSYDGQISRLTLLDYALFVTFFPQLISGPIVHHREVIPQFQRDSSLRYSRRLVPIAISFLVFGACKKVLLADNLSVQVGAAFQYASAGHHHDLVGGWLGALAYTLQVYLDFSGYSDMAIGLGLLFGIRLPVNFNSPLKARNIIEFWSRWHMTLTRFLTAYIYNPLVLAATRRRMRSGKKVATKGVMSGGAFVRLLVIPTLITFFLAGAWHGAGFQFIAFGVIHGVYLVVTHAWRNFRKGRAGGVTATPVATVVARLATFIAIVVSIPFFRADSVRTAVDLVSSMGGLHGIWHHTAQYDLQFLALVVASFVLVQVFPNTHELMHRELDAATDQLVAHPGDAKGTSPTWSWPRWSWQPTVRWAIFLALAAWLVLLMMAAPSEFLYFQF